MNALKLQKNINYGTTLPVLVFIAGLLVIFFFSSQQYGEAMLFLLVSATLYTIMKIIKNSDINPPTQYNQILENISTYLTFGITPIMFAIHFYSEEKTLPLILLIFFYAIATALSMARNWDHDTSESLGLPIAFNGIFLPLFYYMFKFYFKEPGSSIFLIYFIFAGILTLTNFKFLGFETKLTDNKQLQLSKQELEDKITKKRIKEREQKQFEKEKNEIQNKNNKTEKTNNLPNKKIQEEIITEIKTKRTQKEKLEKSNLEKIKTFIYNKLHTKDNFNEIKGMPTKQELNETLPHRLDQQKENEKIINQAFNIKPKPKTKKTIFQKIIKYLYIKLGQEEKHWSDIKGMPNEAEIKETLTQKKKQTKPQNTKTENDIPTEQEIIETLTPEQTTQTPIQTQTKINQPTKQNQNETIQINGEEYDLEDYEIDFDEKKL